MEGIVVAIALAFLVALAVYAPLARKSSESLARPAKEKELLADLTARKNGILLAIKDLDFEFEQSKLSEQDYLTLRDRYERQAISILKRIDDLRSEIEKSRSARGQNFCRECGHPVRDGHKFCSKCGARQ